MIWIKTEDVNMTVTEFYLRIIGNAFEILDQQVIYKSVVQEIKPNPGDIVVLSTAPDVIRFLRKNVKIVFWAQGAWPEESLMRHSSKIRYAVTSWVEKAALKRADYVFFVSDAMRNHYERKYKLSFSNNYYIMPCANENFHEEAFNDQEKYDQNVFCYAGATSVWQCFEETIDLYSRIEQNIPDSKLLLLVKDRELALQMIDKYHVKNYEIDFVPVDRLPERLRGVKFGFILRKPSVVNEVATPTKTLTYLSNGIIPIFSDCLKGISEILQGCKYRVEVPEGKELDPILEMTKTHIDNTDILKEYTHVYLKHYDRETHVEKIADCIRRSGILG